MKTYKFSILCHGNRKFGLIVKAENELSAYYEFWKKFLNEWKLGTSPIGSNLPYQIDCTKQ